jgi:hypothetical protein
VTAVIGVWAVVDQRANTERVTQALESTRADLTSTEADLNKVKAEKEALSKVSFPAFLEQYNGHVATLKTATEAYDKAKPAKGVNIAGSDAASMLVHAESDLYGSIDNFTDFIDLWRQVAELFNKMLDGNVTQLKDFRRVNNTTDVHDMAWRIIRDAPNLAEPLRTKLDSLRASP